VYIFTSISNSGNTTSVSIQQFVSETISATYFGFKLNEENWLSDTFYVIVLCNN